MEGITHNSSINSLKYESLTGKELPILALYAV